MQGCRRRARVGQVEIVEQPGSQVGEAIRSAQRFDQIKYQLRPIERERFFEGLEIQRTGDSPRGMPQSLERLLDGLPVDPGWVVDVDPQSML